MLDKMKTLRVKFSVITLFTYLTLVTVIIVACHLRFTNMTKSYYNRIGTETLDIIASELNVDAISDYLSGTYDKEDYQKDLSVLNRYANYYNDIFYLYVLSFNDRSDDTATYVFDAETKADDDFNKLNDTYVLEPELKESIDDFRSGKFVEPFNDNTEYGYLMTLSRPLVDSNGVCQAYVFIDFNLDAVNHSNSYFTLNLYLIVLPLMLIIFSAGMTAVSVRITKPIEQMYKCLSSFTYNTNQERWDNVQKLKDLNIHTNMEIQKLYNALISTTEDSIVFLGEYQTVTKKLDVATEKAYTDPLTGCYSKTAYDDKIQHLQQVFDVEHFKDFSFIMLDINNLKYINDNFGHKYGDNYIVGCYKLTQELCKHSSIYRIGGDEFVIILEGPDHIDRLSIYEELQSKFESTYLTKTLNPWERYSASLGLSECTDKDVSVLDIFKRADSAMYQHKSQFKDKYGSYR